MGVRFTVCVLLLAVGCVQPTFTKCPDVDCPASMVCDGQGGCALPAQLAQCNGQDNGASCSYVDIKSSTIDGACSNNICLPIGCGNMIVTPNETCDDGNTVNGDGCSADCQSNETCGNSAVDPATGEQCDDGNATDGDGCQHDCKNPRCGDGIKDDNLNEECDAGDSASMAPDAACRPNCQLPRCGDGVTDPGMLEVCDDGNNAADDGCSGDCKSDETCGNGVVDVLAGEVCDDNNTNSNDGCRADCLSTEACGNNVIDTARGEVCDDGGTVNGDGCSSDCKSLETCGNGILDTIDEQCDLGTATNSDLPNSMCRTNCKFPSCGDGVFDNLLNEQCDNGTNNGNSADKCRTNCQLPRCGDTIKDMTEACDDGNFNSGDNCSGDCKSNETCGNSYVDTVKGEQCDLGAANSNAANAACRTDCKLPKCGDGVVDTTLGETCDLGALNSNAANANCRLNCQPQRCGDGVFDNAKGEVCDDGNVVSGDNCAADCKSNETCGNGIIDSVKGETCDAGALNSNLANAPCRTSCLLPRCGDSAVDTNLGEACDLGALNSNAANANCRLNCQPQRCGDLVIDNTKGEVCDDGNQVAGDNCSPDCKSNETCGNSIVDIAKGEQCDAGGSNSNLANAPCRTDCKLPRCGDGAIDTTRGEACDAGALNSNSPNANCRTNCQPQRCGDGIFDNTKGEVCDDGNVASGDNCSNDCKSLEVCGNGIVDTVDGEQCDDGNSTNTDFCHNNCTLPRCGDAIVDFNEQCDNGTAMNSNNPNATCRPTCTLRRCGDMIVDNLSNEVCDDGNLAFADGCTPDCRSNESCGNNIVDLTVGELCDDGNLRGRDGCSKCKVEDAVLLEPNVGFGWINDHTMAYDAARKKTVMFHYGTTYEWDGAAWRQMNARRNPQPRYGNGLAYDPVRKRVVLFGGYYNNAFNDTWEWDGNDWTQIITTTQPNPREQTFMAFDGNRNKIVLYGGYDSEGLYDQTWEWDGTNWALIATTGQLPGQRCGHSMAFDAARKEMMLWGGGCGSPQTVYTFNGTTRVWTARGTFPSIEAGWHQYMAYDPNRSAVVLLAKPAVTYEWNGTTWSTITAATPGPQTGYGVFYNGAMVYDAARSQLVLMGGYTCPLVSGSCQPNQTWTRTNTTWATPPAFAMPPERSRAAIAYDPARGKVVMFGGDRSGCAYCNNDLNDTWEWDGRRWSQPAVSGSPSARAGGWADYNTSTRTVMMFGGTHYDGNAFNFYPQLYSFNGSSWSLAANSSGHPDVRNTAIAYDGANNKFVTFGGQNFSIGDHDQTWTWTSAAGWTNPTPATRPAARRTHAMAYDPLRRKVVMFGGVSASTGNNVADIWEFDGMTNTWTQINKSGPLPRRGTTMFYNPDLGAMNLFGNNTQGTGEEDLWEWNGTTWTQRPLAVPTYPNYRAATAYDAARHEVVLFGGRNNMYGFNIMRYRPLVTTEACTFANVDYDGDGLAGCADPECWSVCTPMCPPGTTGNCTTTVSPRCGNGTCEPLEDCDLCPSDCTSGCTTNVCGDFRCNGTENRTSCPHDCP